MKTVDEIHALDLHANAKKRQRCPDGSKDENAFDMMQGSAMCIMVKDPPAKSKGERA